MNVAAPAPLNAPANTSRTWSAVARDASADRERPAFVRRVAGTLSNVRTTLDLPGDTRLGDLREALAGLEPVATHRTSVAGARALLDATSWRSSDLGRGEQMRAAGVLGASEDSTGIGFVAVHLRDPASEEPLATPASAAGYGEVRLLFEPDTLHDMTFTARQHHEMRPGDVVPRSTIETLHRTYAQRLVDWTRMGGETPAATSDALRGWLLQQDQQAYFLLEGQARDLRGDRIRAIELFPGAEDAATGVRELVDAARARGIDVIDRRT